jgi:hypothetical protein
MATSTAKYDLRKYNKKHGEIHFQKTSRFYVFRMKKQRIKYVDEIAASITL